MHSLRRLSGVFRFRRYAHLAVAFLAVSNQVVFVALAAGPSVVSAPTTGVCSAAGDRTATAQPRCVLPSPAEDQHVAVPAGATQCPESGAGAACGGFNASSQLQPGISSTPGGTTACPIPVGKSGPTSPAACTETSLSPQATIDAATRGDSVTSTVTPSVPINSLDATGQPQGLTLSVDATTVQSGQSATLTATASRSVTNTSSAIEIFDRSAGTVVGACMQASQCMVGYSAKSGVHTFAAFVTPPTTRLPVQGPNVASNSLAVTWLGVTLASNSTVVAPGRPVTLTATSTVDVGRSGRSIVIYDNTSKSRLTFCSRGTTCTTSLTQATGSVHQILAWIPGHPEAVSQGISVTWLKVTLEANTTYPKVGGTVHLTATSNIDLADTPWSMGIYDQTGSLVDEPCKSGTTCAAAITLTSGVMPWYTAAIGTVPAMSAASTLGQLMRKVGGPTSLVGLQARSASVRPTRMLWGVDSCKAFTSSATGGDGLYPQVLSHYGRPDFWGRYLTNTVCPGISSAEVAAAAYNHMGILPIYNDYDCSAVVGYSTGRAYAGAATAAAATLGIPQGRAVAIDIEPPGAACPGAANVDAGFVGGWFDGVNAAGYVPTYYGNGTAGSEFASAWCAAVSAQPSVAADSYLWSFEPSLLGSYTKAAAPNYSPQQTGCPGSMAAWQYELSTGSDPDVDTDEALTTLPLWFPTNLS